MSCAISLVPTLMVSTHSSSDMSSVLTTKMIKCSHHVLRKCSLNLLGFFCGVAPFAVTGGLV